MKLIDFKKIFFLFLGKQLKASSHAYERLNSKSNLNVPISSMKQVTNILKPKENIKSKYLQIEKDGK